MMENKRSGKELEQFKSVYELIIKKKKMTIFARDIEAWKVRFKNWMKENHPDDLELVDKFIK